MTWLIGLQVATVVLVILDLGVTIWALTHVRAPKPPYGPVR